MLRCPDKRPSHSRLAPPAAEKTVCRRARPAPGQEEAQGPGSSLENIRTAGQRGHSDPARRSGCKPRLSLEQAGSCGRQGWKVLPGRSWRIVQTWVRLVSVRTCAEHGKVEETRGVFCTGFFQASRERELICSAENIVGG